MKKIYQIVILPFIMLINCNIQANTTLKRVIAGLGIETGYAGIVTGTVIGGISLVGGLVLAHAALQIHDDFDDPVKKKQKCARCLKIGGLGIGIGGAIGLAGLGLLHWCKFLSQTNPSFHGDEILRGIHQTTGSGLLAMLSLGFGIYAHFWTMPSSLLPRSSADNMNTTMNERFSYGLPSVLSSLVFGFGAIILGRKAIYNFKGEKALAHNLISR